MTPPITTLQLPHTPPSLAVHVALCRNLKNADFLRQQLLDGNPDFEYALLDASTVGFPGGPPPVTQLEPLFLATGG